MYTAVCMYIYSVCSSASVYIHCVLYYIHYMYVEVHIVVCVCHMGTQMRVVC